jgi:hypothetical protein
MSGHSSVMAQLPVWGCQRGARSAASMNDVDTDDADLWAVEGWSRGPRKRAGSSAVEASWRLCCRRHFAATGRLWSRRPWCWLLFRVNLASRSSALRRSTTNTKACRTDGTSSACHPPCGLDDPPHRATRREPDTPAIPACPHANLTALAKASTTTVVRDHDKAASLQR